MARRGVRGGGGGGARGADGWQGGARPWLASSIRIAGALQAACEGSPKVKILSGDVFVRRKAWRLAEAPRLADMGHPLFWRATWAERLRGTRTPPTLRPHGSAQLLAYLTRFLFARPHLQEEWRSIGVQQSRGWVHYGELRAFERPQSAALVSGGCIAALRDGCRLTIPSTLPSQAQAPSRTKTLSAHCPSFRPTPRCLVGLPLSFRSPERLTPALSDPPAGAAYHAVQAHAQLPAATGGLGA